MLVFSVPWAHVADVRGRKPVLLLLTSALFVKYAFVQLVCFFEGAIPLRWPWLSALHTVFGGSVTVATALIYTVISDVVPEDDRYVFIPLSRKCWVNKRIQGVSLLPGYGRDNHHTIPWVAYKRRPHGLEPLAANDPWPVE